MNFDPNEILYLTAESWGGTFPEQWTPSDKGKAIDWFIKNIFGGAGEQYAPYDLKLLINGCLFHEIKSGTRKWIGLSPNEKEHADAELSKGNDTLIWYFEQLPARDEFRFFAIARYSRVQNFFFPSNYDTSNVKRGDIWVVEATPSINKYTLRDHGEAL